MAKRLETSVPQETTSDSSTAELVLKRARKIKKQAVKRGSVFDFSHRKMYGSGGSKELETVDIFGIEILERRVQMDGRIQTTIYGNTGIGDVHVSVEVVERPGEPAFLGRIKRWSDYEGRASGIDDEAVFSAIGIIPKK